MDISFLLFLGTLIIGIAAVWSIARIVFKTRNGIYVKDTNGKQLSLNADQIDYLIIQKLMNSVKVFLEKLFQHERNQTENISSRSSKSKEYKSIIDIFPYGAPELKEAFRRYLWEALLFAVGFELLIINSYYITKFFDDDEPPPDRMVRIKKYADAITYADVGPPPKISENSRELSMADIDTRSSRGIPVPTAENQKSESQIFDNSKLWDPTLSKGLSLNQTGIDATLGRFEDAIGVVTAQLDEASQEGDLNLSSTSITESPSRALLPERDSLPLIGQAPEPSINEREVNIFDTRFTLIEISTISLKYHSDWNALESTIERCYRQSLRSGSPPSDNYELLNNGITVNFQLKSGIQGQLLYTGRLAIRINALHRQAVLSSLKELQHDIERLFL